MGRVISVEELRLGQYPKIGTHRVAAEQMMDGMQQIGKNLGIEDDLSYMIHGSVGVGREKRRSDIDFIAIFPHQLASESLRKILPLMRKVHDEHNIPVEYNLITDKEAAEGNHRVLPMFRDYLRGAQEKSQYVVGKPIDLIVISSDEEFKPDFIKYTMQKRDAFWQAYTNSNTEVDWKRFGRALELPKAIKMKLEQLGYVALTELTQHPLETEDRCVTDCIESVIDNEGYTADAYGVYVKSRYSDVIRLAAALSMNCCMYYQQDDIPTHKNI